MKRLTRYVTLLVLACIVGTGYVGAKVKMQPVYMFGVAASLLDSVVYVTDLQYVDSAYVDDKSGFLMERPLYTLQLQQFVEGSEKRQNLTCVVFFHKKKAKAEKKLQKIKKKFRASKDLHLAAFPEGAFRFHAEEWTQTNVEVTRPAAASPEGKKDKAEKSTEGKKKSKSGKSKEKAAMPNLGEVG